MAVMSVVLVVRANGEVRVARRPRIAPDEIGVRLNINLPAGWGTVLGTLDIDMPEPPVVTSSGVVTGDTADG